MRILGVLGTKLPAARVTQPIPTGMMPTAMPGIPLQHGPATALIAMEQDQMAIAGVEQQQPMAALPLTLAPIVEETWFIRLARLTVAISIFAGISLAASMPAFAKHPRSHAAIAEFKRLHPCPATSERRGKCPGYIIDHPHAICVGGPDTSGNMRWMTVAAAKAKDRWECKPGWEDRLKECEASGCFVQ